MERTVKQVGFVLFGLFLPLGIFAWAVLYRAQLDFALAAAVTIWLAAVRLYRGDTRTAAVTAVAGGVVCAGAWGTSLLALLASLAVAVVIAVAAARRGE
jgi:hypothetical protein